MSAVPFPWTPHKRDDGQMCDGDMMDGLALRRSCPVCGWSPYPKPHPSAITRVDGETEDTP